MRITLEGVERELAQMALEELIGSRNAAEARFAQRVAPIRQAHGLVDGVKAVFGADGVAIFIDVEDPKPA